MGYQSTDEVNFRGTVARWIAEHGEVSALIRFSHAGGAKSFEFFDAIEPFDARLRELAERTCIIVFGERQLPLRGRVDDLFIESALTSYREGTEYLVVGQQKTVCGKASWYRHSAGESSDEFRESLESFRGESAACGAYPPWLDDGEFIISAVVPDRDGSVSTGVY